jgi:hypothetical protein
LLAVAVLGGCGGSPASPGGQVTSAGHDTTSAPSPTVDSSGSSTHKPPAPVVSIQDGPASPISPDTDSYYYRLERHQCTTLSKSGTDNPEAALFTALGHVCLAIQQPGSKVDWPAASAALAGSADLTDCLMVAARGMLKRALDAHHAHPDRTATFGTAPGHPACQPVVRSVVLVNDPAVSSQPYLWVTGDRLFEVRQVHVAGHTLTTPPPKNPNLQDGEDCGQVQVLHPPALSAGTSASIRVVGAGYTVSTAWHVTPAVPADLVHPSEDGTCGLLVDAPTPGAS